MKPKSIIINIILLAAGLLLGWLIFGGDQSETHDHKTEAVSEYTCSMHPQIRQQGPGKCPICGMDLTPVSSGSSTSNPFVLEMTPEAAALANIQTTKVKSVSASNELMLTGKVKVNEQALSVVAAKFPGRIEKLFVNFVGQEIKKGEKLATLYSPELVTAQRELLEAKKMASISPQLYEAAKEKLRLWKISDKQIEQIESSGQVTTTLDVYAETSGVVTKRQVSLGDYLSTGSVMMEIANLSSVWVVLDAYESDLPWIKTGSTINFTVPSLPGKEFNAKIHYINPSVSPETRSVDVRAIVPNTGNLLKPEMLVSATLQTKLNSNVKGLAIPATTVLWTGKRSVVYVKQKGTTPAFERREITLGARMNDVYIVEKGLDEGEEVVSNGVFSVDASAQLSGNYSMMSSPEIKSIDVPEAFRAQLTQVVEKYYAVKNALVESNPALAATAAKEVLKALKAVNMKLLEGAAHDEWMVLTKPLEQGATGISTKTDVEEQRKDFELLSNYLIEAVELFGLTTEKAYRAYCPMAFEDEGAYWLSEFEDIKNPYFGATMLKCGENREVFRKR
ncbi:MAG: efflux RND transporter periplasmic adaptor subunit [Cyclobacteriaceae bacterium]|nr:efflux RND transporter periplasmic adaptor subunit [Cyclobacteriaceae bacterium]UYN87647.1 MAG: efflux RND transporter periplasmic adaptor subunit [Cyclobacteriaceae bacterium]